MPARQAQREPMVFVVDDDDAVRDSLQFLMKSVGLPVATFASGQEFLEAYDPDWPGCLVLDIRMPGMSGIDLQQKLKDQCTALPIIFITGHGDVPMAVKAIQDGAADFIQKPFRDQDLLDRINGALQQGARDRDALLERNGILQRMASLTDREHQVMELVTEGKANKVIAMDLGVSQRTVEIHRANVMEKMQVRSLARLVRSLHRAQYFASDSG